MVVRVSTHQIFESGLRGIQTAQSSVARTQAEIAAGKRLLTPADDPGGAALALAIEQGIARSRQFVRNIDLAQQELAVEETQLAAVEDVLFRLRELVVSAGNDVYTGAERAIIANELETLAGELAGIFNTRQPNGEYLFAGHQGLDQPFVARPGGVVEYLGDTGQRFVQIDAGIDVEVRDDGKGLFVDVPAANNTFVTRLAPTNTGDGDLSVGRIVDQAAWDAVFPDDLLIRFDDPLGPGSFTVYQRDRTTGALAALATQAYVPGEPVTVAGVEVAILGTPANGDEFVLEATNRQSLITTVQRIALVLRSSADTAAGAAERGLAVAEALENLTQAESHVFSARAELGARLALLDSVREEHAELELVDRELLSDIVDLDFNEAVSRLSFQSFVLEAAQKSFVRISGLSLFDLL